MTVGNVLFYSLGWVLLYAIMGEKAYHAENTPVWHVAILIFGGASFLLKATIDFMDAWYRR